MIIYIRSMITPHSPPVEPAMNLTTAPSFDRARMLSRGVSWISTFMMGAITLGVIAIFIVMLFFFDVLRDMMLTKAAAAMKDANLPQADEAIALFFSLSFGQRTMLAVCFAVAIAPTLFVLFHLRAVFARFAGGQIFTDDNIKGLSMVGLGLVASVVMSIIAKSVITHIIPLTNSELVHVIPLTNANDGVSLTPLFYGAITYVAAYVMGEGRRISDDNAGIV